MQVEKKKGISEENDLVEAPSQSLRGTRGADPEKTRKEVDRLSASPQKKEQTDSGLRARLKKEYL